MKNDSRRFWVLNALVWCVYAVLGTLSTVKLTGEDTDGAYAVWVDAVAPGSGPPRPGRA